MSEYNTINIENKSQTSTDRLRSRCFVDVSDELGLVCILTGGFVLLAVGHDCGSEY